MARSPVRVVTKGFRRLTLSCSTEQASHLMNAQKRRGAKKRDGNCTVQSAEYVLRFGHGTPFATDFGTRKPEARTRERSAPKHESAVAGWWKVFGFDEQGRAGSRAGSRQLPAPQRSAAEELGLPTTSQPTKAQVKDAFRKRALAVHPDHGGSSTDFRKAMEARDTLLRVAR